MKRAGCIAIAACLSCVGPSLALDRPEVTYQVFQFPADQIPRIDGDSADWKLVPEGYVVGGDRLTEQNEPGRKEPRAHPDVRVRVGWVAGLNRLYFLYEADDDYWDFASPGLHNDTFELVVDGDASGGPLVDHDQPKLMTPEQVGNARSPADPRIPQSEEHWAVHGVHAQNYHIFTPALDKDWTMAWGAPTWIKEFPHANSATRHALRPGERGHLVLEFWITPYDYAGAEGPQRAVETLLSENRIIGLGWVLIDYDDVNSSANNGFWTLSSKRTMFGNASELPAFRLMPLEPALRPKLTAQWSFTVVDMSRRLVSFQDRSFGRITGWQWDFGDGQTSSEQHPQHRYAKPDNYVVTLVVNGPDGSARRSKVWDVQLK